MKITYISWLPAVAMMVIIFLFSSKTAVYSNESSMNIASSVLTIYEQTIGVVQDEPDRIKQLETINHYIRKTAHFCEYALLSCAFLLHLLALKKKGIWLVVPPIILSAIYASTDEFHQTMVSGRGGMVRDVFLDTSGAVAGALIFFLFLTLYDRRRKRS